jgi:uncharacterized membrane-anchored protein YitT (DUF2179 family)
MAGRSENDATVDGEEGNHLSPYSTVKQWLPHKLILAWTGLTVGSLLVALGLDVFFVPNRIASGGVTGLATILFYVLKIPLSWTIMSSNIVLLFLCYRELGLRLVVRTLYGAAVTSVFCDLLLFRVPVLTHDPLLSSIYGGIVCGLGMGIVLRSGGTTGGTDLVARLIAKYLPVTLGQGLMAADSMIIVLAGIFFNAQLALYGLLGLLATSYVIDLVQEGFSVARTAFIITNHSEEIAQAIFRELGRGVTALSGRGMYTGEQRPVLISVVAKTEESRLKDLIYQVDTEAFVFFTDAREVLGEGFKSYR